MRRASAWGGGPDPSTSQQLPAAQRPRSPCPSGLSFPSCNRGAVGPSLPKDIPSLGGDALWLGQAGHYAHPPAKVAPTASQAHRHLTPALSEDLRGEDRKQEAGPTAASWLPGSAEMKGGRSEIQVPRATLWELQITNCSCGALLPTTHTWGCKGGHPTSCTLPWGLLSIHSSSGKDLRTPGA